MRLVQINDAHIRGSSPKSRMDDYPETLYKKFCELGTFIKENEVEAILNGGDLFDTPDPSTSIVNRYVKLFSSWNIPMYSVVGSHDKFGYNDTTINRTALGTLRAAGITELISTPQNIGPGCSVAGISHSYTLDEDPENDYYYKKDSDDYLIQLCHGMITEGPFFGKYTLYNQIRTDADLVICGHYHPGFGPFNNNGSTVVNIGSMGRTEHTLRRFPPGFIFIDTDIPTWEFHPFTVIEDPFLTKKQVATSTMIDMEQFISSLKKKVGDFEKKDVNELILALGKKQGLSSDTIKRALRYIENE